MIADSKPEIYFPWVGRDFPCPSPEGIPRLLIVMGVAGSGKTTVGRLLARALGWPFYDGDDYQPAANINKMAQGLSLNDQDRLPWLLALHDLGSGILSTRGQGVLACSALKQAYRQVLLRDLERTGLIYLKGSYAMMEARLKVRKDHYFKSNLLASQFEILEEPEDALTLDAAEPPDALVQSILHAFTLDHLASDPAA